MAKHYIGARKKPQAEIKAAPTWYERTHPVGSAERFLDEAAKEALVAAAAGGVVTPRQAAVGAAKAVADEMEKYPDPLLAEAAKLPKDELLKRAVKAEAFQKAMDAQNRAVAVITAVDSPVGRTATTLAAANAAEAVQQAAKGGDSAGKSDLADPPPEDRPTVPETGGPRIVINPTTFRNKKDALCVAFNEGFRLWMEAAGFEPQSEPTDAQRRFFSDTAYADDEVQLRRTILARIATFDTSVKDPTDDQLAETGSFLDEILESDWCKNDWERNAVSRLSQAVKASVGAEPVEPRQEPLEARETEPLQMRAAMGGGETEDEKEAPAQEPVRETGDDPGLAGSGADNGEGGTTTSGDGTVVSYNADGTFAGETRADGSYSLASGSGEVVNYNKDGTLQEPEQPGPSGAPSQQDASQSPAQDASQSPAQDTPAKEPTDWDRKLQATGLHSGVFKTMADGSQRELTGTEAAALRRRIDSGASVSGRQLAMFGLSRDEQGRLVSTESAGSADAGRPAGGGTPANPDAGLDREPQKPLPGRRTAARRRT